MDREDFLETIKQQFADEIQEAYLECEHDDGRKIDYPQLQAKLAKLMQHAKVEGLPHSEFEGLVYNLLPQIRGKIVLSPLKKAA